MEITQKICDKNEWIKLYFLVVSDVKFTIEIHQFKNGMKYKMSKSIMLDTVGHVKRYSGDA